MPPELGVRKDASFLVDERSQGHSAGKTDSEFDSAGAKRSRLNYQEESGSSDSEEEEEELWLISDTSMEEEDGKLGASGGLGNKVIYISDSEEDVVPSRSVTDTPAKIVPSSLSQPRRNIFAPPFSHDDVSHASTGAIPSVQPRRNIFASPSSDPKSSPGVGSSREHQPKKTPQTSPGKGTPRAKAIRVKDTLEKHVSRFADGPGSSAEENSSDDELFMTPQNSPGKMMVGTPRCNADRPSSNLSSAAKSSQRSTAAKRSKSPAKKSSSPAKPSLRNKPEKDWRMTYSHQLYDELNHQVFDMKLPKDVKLVWSTRLRTTAGRAELHKDRHGVEDIKINLASKVLDCEERIKFTLCHEMCHLACWLISRDLKEVHGETFLQWARYAMYKRPDITVSTRHTYEINFTWQWKCVICGWMCGRWSESIDTAEAACPCRPKGMQDGPQCMGDLELFKWPKDKTPKKIGGAKAAREAPAGTHMRPARRKKVPVEDLDPILSEIEALDNITRTFIDLTIDEES